jgi:tetratricopeptide (TPR) repeat protein
MVRFAILMSVAGLLAAGQESARSKPEEKQPQKQEQEPPEEDESLAPKEYSFNPLQAEKEIKTGNFYSRKGNHRAAALRYEEATKWNPGLAEAYLKLGEAREKYKDMKRAREAYAKYLELAPDAKNAASIRKKLGENGKAPQ